MSKFIVVGDVHIDSTPPEKRKSDFFDTVLGKLDQVNYIAKSEGVDTAIITGDLFHRRNIPTSYLGRLVNFFVKSELDWYSIAGNHDLKYGNKEYLEESPLNILFQSGAIKDLTKDKPDIDTEITAYHFDKNPSIDKDKEGIMVGHWYLGEMWGSVKESVMPEDLNETNFYLAIMGHDHNKKQKEFNGTKFLCPGALARLSSHEDDLQRNVKVYTIDTDDYTIKGTEIDTQKIEKAYDTNSIEADNRKKELEDYVENLNSKDNEELEIVQILHNLVEDSEIEGMVEDYLREFDLV